MCYSAWPLSGVATGNAPVTTAQEAMRQWSLVRLSADDRAFIAAFATNIIPLIFADSCVIIVNMIYDSCIMLGYPALSTASAQAEARSPGHDDVTWLLLVTRGK
jgi:hypothetical protein